MAPCRTHQNKITVRQPRHPLHRAVCGTFPSISSMFDFRVCDHLGNFSNDLEAMISNNLYTICTNPSEFVDQIIVLLHSKIVTVLKESPYFPHQLREAMERALPTLQAKSYVFAVPLRTIMASPQASAACRVSAQGMNNPLVKQLVEKIKSTIDSKVAQICSSTETKVKPSGGKRRRTARKSRKGRKARKSRRTNLKA